MSHGSLTGAVAGGLAASTVITTGVNDTLTVDVDGVVANITLPAGTYSQAALATQLQTSLTAGLGTSGVSAVVTLSAAPTNLIIQSGSVGTSGTQGSGSTVTVTGGTAQAALLGAAPVAVSGLDNFDPNNASSYTASTAQTVYDSLGNPHNMTMYFAKTSFPGRYQMYTSLDGGTVSAASQIQFSNTGALTSAMPVNQSFTITNGAISPLTFPLDLTGTTQYGVEFGVNQLIQDGFTSGRLTGVSVAADGIVQGRYSNGKSQNLGQVVLVNFNNPNSLQQLGSNQWAETSESGQPIPGTPGQGSLGAIQSGAVEESNVDLTAELVNMITQQRAYQANAQSIKTQDSVLQTLVNLR
jgi:flagellar hook protein FlgE